MCEYTAQEIAEALRNCDSNDCCCMDCPMLGSDACENLGSNAADMIDALLEELEKTKAERDKLRETCMSAGKTNQRPVWSHEVVDNAVKLLKEATYQRGRADALETFINHYFFDEVSGNE